jgi:hypothetical protein
MLMDWREAVVRITGSDRGKKPFGSGFVCGREQVPEGTRKMPRTYVLTCWHVVKAIKAVAKRSATILVVLQPVSGAAEPRTFEAEVVAEGDEALDLALLAVSGLADAPILSLWSAAHSGHEFVTRGSFSMDLRTEDVGVVRELSGKLGQDAHFSSKKWEGVPAWEYQITQEVAFDEIKDGYSGAPVLVPELGRVVAVISNRAGHDKGHTIDVGSLKQIYPDADSLFLDPRERAEGVIRQDHLAGREGLAEDLSHEYQLGDDPIIKTLDHAGQIARLHDLLTDDRRDRAIALFDACFDDRPEYLADHVLLEPWPDASARCDEPFSIHLRRPDRSGFWEALVDAIPRARLAPDRPAQQIAVRNWINDSSCRVIFLSVPVSSYGRHLADIVAGVHEALEALGELRPNVHVLVLVACLLDGLVPRLWWPLFKRLRLAGRHELVSVGALRPLTQVDVHLWLDGFPIQLRKVYDCDQLRTDLFELFSYWRRKIRYAEVRACLIEHGALARASVHRRVPVGNTTPSPKETQS